MAWNPSPKVAAARDIGNKFGANKVILILISDRAGTMEAISYGDTPETCRMTQALADVAYDAVFDQIKSS